MPDLTSEMPIRRGMIRGRESRNQTLTTKLTEAEYRAVQQAALADTKTTGEWLRDLALDTLHGRSADTGTVLLSEVVGVRLLLVNVLRSLATGQKIAPETFDKLLNDISTTKYELAEKLASEKRR